jgi:hypothetical protein
LSKLLPVAALVVARLQQAWDNYPAALVLARVLTRPNISQAR